MATTRIPWRLVCLSAFLVPALGVSSAAATDDAQVRGIPTKASAVLRGVVSTRTARVVGRGGPIGIGLSRTSQLRVARSDFQLPSDLSRPRPGWWLMAADVHLELAPDSGLGEAVIGVGSNGRTWGQIEIFKKPGTSQPIIEWNTLDIVRGYTVRRAAGDRVVVPVVNFPPLQAVRRGTNVLRLSVQELGDIHIARVDVPTVAVLSTSLVPEPLRLSASSRSLGVVHANDMVSVPYTLRNLNPTPLRRLRLSIAQEHGVTAEPDAGEVPPLTGTRHGVVHVHVRHKGAVGFDLIAKTATASSQVRLTFNSDDALPSAHRRDGLLWGLAAAVIVVVAGLGWIGIRHSRAR